VKVLNSFPEDVMAQAKHIKLLALDVDGVLTDGSIYVDSNGNESKKFYVHDGYGIVSIREVCDLIEYSNQRVIDD